MMMKLNTLLAGGSLVSAVQIQGDASKQEDVPEGAVMAGHGWVKPEEIEKVKAEVEELIKKNPEGFRIPVRSHMDDATVAESGKKPEDFWRFKQPPDYTLANASFLKGKTMMHKEGSLEQVVEDLVKTWEMERSHKMDYKDHKTVDQEKFNIGANMGQKYDNVKANEVGNYNVLLDGCNQELYNQKQSWHESHEAFKGAFQTFPWEVIKVYTGPPVVGFAWRHWGHFIGEYTAPNGQKNQGKGELLELYGFATAQVNDKLQLCDVQTFFDSEPFLKALAGEEQKAGAMGPCSFFGNKEGPASNGGCPFPHGQAQKKETDCACM